MWDKNRPTRIIPRAEVYTSSDVTIEELRGEGDGPALTPRRSRSSSARRSAATKSSSNRSSLLLAVDVGNTQTVFGLYDGDRLTQHWRVATEVERTGDELGVLVGSCSSPRPRLPRGHLGRLPLIDGPAAGAGVRGVRPRLRRGAPCSCSARARRSNPDRLRRSPRGRARPDRERRRGPGAPWRPVHRGRLRHVYELRHRLAAGEYVGVLAPGIEVSMEALRPRRAAREGGLLAAASRDRKDHRRRPPVGDGLRLRRSGGRNRQARPGRDRTWHR